MCHSALEKRRTKKEDWLKKLGLTERDLDKIYATMFMFISQDMHKKLSSLTGIDAEKIDKVRREGPFTHTMEYSTKWQLMQKTRTTLSSRSLPKC